MADEVIATRTRAPAWVSAEARSTTLYAAIPPEINRAIRIPRSSLGTGVGSSGMGLSYAPPGVFDDLTDLADRTLDVVIRHHVLVLRRVCHLASGDLPPGSQILRRLAASLHLTPLQLLLRKIGRASCRERLEARV